MGLSDYDATNIVENRDIALYYEEIIKHTKNYKNAANWLMGSIKSYLNQMSVEITSFPIPAKNIAQLVTLIESGKINNNIASQKVFPAMLENPKASPEELAVANDWIVQGDSNELEAIVKNIFEKNPDETKRFKDGEKKLTGFFMGLVMRESKGKADPKTTTQLLNKIIETL